MSQADVPAGSFMRELKRRKVVRSVVLYVVLCWGALQVGDILFPAVGLDAENASRIFLYLALLGLPVTVAMSWFFQITAHGIVRTTSFVERRVLNNLSPINNRRHDGVSTYFRAEEEARKYNWILSVETGPLAGLSYGVAETLVLGRALDCNIAVVSPHVSRQHARLELEGDQLVVTQLPNAMTGLRVEAVNE